MCKKLKVNWKSNKLELFAKIILLLICLIVSFLIVKLTINDEESSYNNKEKEIIGEGKPSEGKKFALKREDYLKETLASMRETNSTFLNWSILLLTGTFGLIITNKSIKRRVLNWSYCLIPPAWLFLFYSLYYAVDFKRRLAFLLATESFNPFALNAELWYQVLFFWLSLIPLSIIIFMYFILRFFSTE